MTFALDFEGKSFTESFKNVLKLKNQNFLVLYEFTVLGGWDESYNLALGINPFGDQ